MKTALVTTCYLNIDDYFDKTNKFCNYYYSLQNDLNIDDIILIDNASCKGARIGLLNWINEDCPIRIVHFKDFLGRDSHLSYPYLWRAVYHLKELFKDYDKVIYMDNDFYITSSKLTDYINNLNSGWTTLWCPKHKFPETGIHIVTKDCKEYQDFVKSGNFMEHNGRMMETKLPVTEVNKTFKGDRWSEYQNSESIPEEADFSAQTPLGWKVNYNG